MEIKKALYGSSPKRIAMRLLEIFVISGLIFVLESSEFQALLPALYVGILAAVVKALREYLNKN